MPSYNSIMRVGGQNKNRIVTNGPYGGAGGSGRGSAAARITKMYVGNLSWDTTWQDLKDHMKTVGHIIRADILEGSDGRSKGCGTVEYADARDAMKAVKTLNDSELNGRRIFVREDREAIMMSAAGKQQPAILTARGPSTQGVAGTRLYVGNLSWDVSWQDLKDHFKQCGIIVRADVLTGSDGRSKGCGIVEFADAFDAANAISTMTDTELNGRMIFVREDRESTGNLGGSVVLGGVGSDSGTGGRVFVGNLPYEVSWQDLKDHFKTIGHIVRADIMEGPDGRSKGAGIVEFEDDHDATRAIQTMNDSELGGRMIYVREDRNK